MLTMRMGSVQDSAEQVEMWKFTVVTTSGGKTTGIPFNLSEDAGVTLTVDWGDGNTSTLTSADYTASDSSASVHEYADAGTYTIKIYCDDWDSLHILGLNSNALASSSGATASLYWWKQTLRTLDSSIPKVAGMVTYANTSSDTLTIRNDSFAYLFCNCTRLASTPSDLFSKNTTITTFASCFRSCSSLSAPDADLFKYNTAVTTFTYCFANIGSLTFATVPADLFKYNTQVTDFSYCFYYNTFLNTIPSTLFATCTAVTTFSSCFMGCSSITSIPAGLFDHNVAVTSFSSCFASCSKLVTIPVDLFKYNTVVTSVSSCFASCSTLGSFSIRIGSSSVSRTGARSFVSKKSSATRTVYVPSNSTTQTSFNSVASNLGLTIIGE